jgi:hypothetical protein
LIHFEYALVVLACPYDLKELVLAIHFSMTFSFSDKPHPRLLELKTLNFLDILGAKVLNLNSYHLQNRTTCNQKGGCTF